MAEHSGVFFPFPLIYFFFSCLSRPFPFSPWPNASWNGMELDREIIDWGGRGRFSAPVLPGPICPVVEHEFWSSLRVGRFTFSGLRFCSLSQCQPICVASMWTMGSMSSSSHVAAPCIVARPGAAADRCLQMMDGPWGPKRNSCLCAYLVFFQWPLATVIIPDVDGSLVGSLRTVLFYQIALL